jgi:hypothetical protein
MRVHYLGLEIPAGTNGVNEIGAEETDEGKFRRP